MTDVLNALAYILGWAALVPCLLFVAAIVGCNVWDGCRRAWRRIQAWADPLAGWWPK